MDQSIPVDPFTCLPDMPCHDCGAPTTRTAADLLPGAFAHAGATCLPCLRLNATIQVAKMRTT